MLSVKDREFAFKIMFVSEAVKRVLQSWLKRMEHRQRSDRETWKLVKGLAEQAEKRRELVAKTVGIGYASGNAFPPTFRLKFALYPECVFTLRLQALEYSAALRCIGQRRAQGEKRRAHRNMAQSLTRLAAHIEDVQQRTMAMPFDENWDRILLKERKRKEKFARKTSK